PPLHRETASPFLEAAIPVLLEKPLATSRAQCEELTAAARLSNVTLGINQNFVFHPAFVRLRKAIAERRLGQPNFVSCVYNVPMRQLVNGQFGHWMFAEPLNILLEQAVHPLSQILALAGKIERFAAMPGVPKEISPGVQFYGSLGLSMNGTLL